MYLHEGEVEMAREERGSLVDDLDLVRVRVRVRGRGRGRGRGRP